MDEINVCILSRIRQGLIPDNWCSVFEDLEWEFLNNKKFVHKNLDFIFDSLIVLCDYNLTLHSMLQTTLNNATIPHFIHMEQLWTYEVLCKLAEQP